LASDLGDRHAVGLYQPLNIFTLSAGNFPRRLKITLGLNTYKYRIVCIGDPMKTNLKRTNYFLDEKKLRRVRTILCAKTETEAIDAALDLVVFRKEILKSLEKVAGKGGVEKVF
jgi:hypothetical protein